MYNSMFSHQRILIPAVVVLVVQSASCNYAQLQEEISVNAPNESREMAVATFGGGCFWCVEAVFEKLEGVQDVVSGYAGGKVPNPTYKQVTTGQTGHAEVCQIHFDPNNVSYTELLEVFWKTHDPTTLNRQGHDIGTQYRSVVFYHDEAQKKTAEFYQQKLDASGVWKDPIVTEISPIVEFFEAEKYHQNYFRNNPFQGYCRVVIVPKMKKFKEMFADKLKTSD